MNSNGKETTGQVETRAGGGNGDAEYLENVTYEELQIGQTASIQRVLSKTDIELFATVSGDINPAHLDEEYAAEGMFKEVIAHGMWGGSLISAVLGTLLPGPGTVYVGQDFRFRRPVGVGDTIIASVTCKEKKDARKIAVFECRCVNQDGKDVITGTAEVIAPIKKIRHERVKLPKVQVIRHDAYDNLLKHAAPLPDINTAIVHPTHASVIKTAVEGKEASLIHPVFVGPAKRIRALAAEARVDISPFEIVDCEHSTESADKAVAMARSGDVDILSLGSLPVEELMEAVNDPEHGLKTSRRMSQVTVISVPSYPRLLLVTDTHINLYPDLDAKVDICQNAIELAHELGVEKPKVAILSAVETVNPKIASTVDASCLCKMADRKQITGGLLDGPLAFDNAISEDAAKTKGIVSEVAGRADILLVPDVEAGSMVAKQLSYLANADSASIVLGARVPIILTGMVDSLRTRLASWSIAVLLANKRRDPTIKVVG